MKTVNLKVGVKGLKGQDALTVPTQVAENPQELMQLARGNADVVVRWANRGKRIEDQERSGARDHLREAVEKAGGAAQFTGNAELKERTRREVADIVAKFDPTQAAARGGPRGPRTVKIEQKKGQKMDLNAFLAALKEKGINIEVSETEETAGAGA